jgi:hypothetical protein
MISNRWSTDHSEIHEQIKDEHLTIVAFNNTYQEFVETKC